MRASCGAAPIICSCAARRSVRGRQPSHRKLDLSVGKLPPVLDDWQVTALRRLTDDFAGLQTDRINRQRKDLSLPDARHPVCQIPGTNEHVTPPWLMLDGSCLLPCHPERLIGKLKSRSGFGC